MQKYWASLTPEQKREKYEASNAKRSEGLQRYRASLTPEQKAEIAEKIRLGLRKRVASLTPEQRRAMSEASRKRMASIPEEERTENARKGGVALWKSMSPEKRAERAKKTSEVARKVLTAYQSALTPEQRSERARNASLSMSAEQRRANAQKANRSIAPERRREISSKAGAAVIAAMTPDQQREMIDNIYPKGEDALNLQPILRIEGGRLGQCQSRHGHQVYDCPKCSKKTLLTRKQWLEWLNEPKSAESKFRKSLK